MKVAVAQINPTLGAFESNFKLIVNQIQKLKANEFDILLFPEAALFGYHPFDLLEQKKIVKDQMKYIQRIQKYIPKGKIIIFGAITINSKKLGRPYFNSAVVMCYQHKPRFFHKCLLPIGDVFDESRFIEAGNMSENILTINGKNILITICEDIWAWPDSDGYSVYKLNPFVEIKKNITNRKIKSKINYEIDHKEILVKNNKTINKIDLILNLSASPYTKTKLNQRLYMASKTSKYFSCPLIYSNLIGAQDEIIFDGQSFAVNNNKLMTLANSFKEDVLLLDTKDLKMGSHLKTKMIPKTNMNTIPNAYANANLNLNENVNVNAKIKTNSKSIVSDLYFALVLGIKDFVNKNNLKKLHLGLSGGIDSALVAVIACDAIGAKNVTCIAMPSLFNDPKSLFYAKELATNLGCQFIELPINKIYEEFLSSLQSNFNHSEFNLVNENLQARIRGVALMAYSNQTGSLLLNTSNKSELAVGYSTLYGDQNGGLSPIGDLTKGEVIKICRFINSKGEVIPNFIIERPPSAELRPNQKDSDSLPDYVKLDNAVESIVTKMSIPRSQLDKWTFSKLLTSEFKRWQAPPILKISDHSFGRGRRWPITNKYKI